MDNLETLKGYLDTIEASLGSSVNADDGNEIATRISELSSLISLSVTAVALAEKLYNIALGERLAKIPAGTSATDKKLILSGRLAEEIYWNTYAERQNAGITHAIDGYRSMLSYLKEERKLNSYQ